MIPRVIEKFAVIVFVYRAKNDKTELRIYLKAAFHSAIFCAHVCEIKNTGAVLPTKDGTQVPVMVVIPLNFAHFTLPKHGNR